MGMGRGRRWEVGRWKGFGGRWRGLGEPGVEEGGKMVEVRRE